MADELSREEFYHALGVLSKGMDRGFEGVNDRLDRINGQVNTHREEIAVLKDRGNRDTTARNTGAVSILSSAAIFVWQKFFAA
ncbi:MAG: hypothetical protein V4792_08010 [Pseudomonadota bacterium]